MQSPKSTPEIPFFTCSIGSILIAGITNALKSENSITVVELLVKDDIFEKIISLKSSTEVLLFLKEENIQPVFSVLISKLSGQEFKHVLLGT